MSGHPYRTPAPVQSAALATVQKPWLCRIGLHFWGFWVHTTYGPMHWEESRYYHECWRCKKIFSWKKLYVRLRRWWSGKRLTRQFCDRCEKRFGPAVRIKPENGLVAACPDCGDGWPWN